MVHSAGVTPTLVVRHGADTETSIRVRLVPGSTVILGRGSGADIVLVGPDISREQARVQYLGDRVTITHVSATTPTLLDRRALQPHRPYPLRHGARIEIGASVLRYETLPALDEQRREPGVGEAGAMDGDHASACGLLRRYVPRVLAAGIATMAVLGLIALLSI